MCKAIYPGSFDPLTNGHLSIIQRGLQMFDGLVVALAINPNKTALFSVAERMDFLREAVSDPRVEIDDFEGLLVHYAKKRNVPVILRGLRAVSDFDYEFQMANMNRKLAPEIETVLRKNFAEMLEKYRAALASGAVAPPAPTRKPRRPPRRSAASRA